MSAGYKHTKIWPLTGHGKNSKKRLKSVFSSVRIVIEKFTPVFLSAPLPEWSQAPDFNPGPISGFDSLAGRNHDTYSYWIGSNVRFPEVQEFEVRS